MEVLVHGQLTHYFWSCGNLYICWRSWEEDSVHSFHDSRKAINMKRKGKYQYPFQSHAPKTQDFPVGPFSQTFSQPPKRIRLEMEPFSKQTFRGHSVSKYSNLHFCNWKFPYFTYLFCCSTFSMLSFLHSLRHLWHLLVSFTVIH